MNMQRLKSQISYAIVTVLVVAIIAALIRKNRAALLATPIIGDFLAFIMDEEGNIPI